MSNSNSLSKTAHEVRLSVANGVLRAAIAAAVLTPALAAGNDFTITDQSFHCITELTHVRHFYVGNLAGNLKGTVKAAMSTTGAHYPVGSVLQLVPTEAMVKREKGFNAVTHDWEFFDIDISPEGSKIRARGFAEVDNRFGANCFSCHVKARPEWDLVCDNNHGCEGIPITRPMIAALQRTDPRCKHDAPPSAEDQAQLQALGEIVKAINAARNPPAPSGASGGGNTGAADSK